MAKTGKKWAPAYSTFDEWWQYLPEKKRNALQGHRDELLRLYRKPRTTDLGWWHDMGVCLKNLFPPDGKRHEVSFMDLVADKLEPNRDPKQQNLVVFLYRFRDFALKFSKAELRKLEAKVRDGKITPDHITYLLTVAPENSTKTMTNFLDDAVTKHWSANELRRAIQDDKTQGLTRYGGRHPKPRTTSNPALAARDITVQARRWSVCHKQYFAPNGPLTKPLKPWNSGLLRELEAALAGLRKVAKEAANARKILKPIVEEIRTAMVSASARNKK